MALIVEWTDFSKQELYKIFNYHRTNANLKIAKKIVLGIRNKTLVLSTHPEIGQDEPHLIGKYKYLIYKNYKIIYKIVFSTELVIISDVFDTRQNPIKISRNK